VFESTAPTVTNVVYFQALERVQSYFSGHSLTHSVKNDCKKIAQFHPKYAFDADGTNATKILKNLLNLKKKVRRSVIMVDSTDNCIYDYNFIY
jgi:archaellum biogenesis ATPase FlaH